jgi:hypothetical protein
MTRTLWARPSAALVFVLMTTGSVSAQAPSPNPNRNPNPSQNVGQSANRNTQQRGEMTIYGVVSAVTTIGETVINYDTNRAELAQATFVTVIGSPEWSGWGQSSDSDRTQGERGEGRAAKRRDSVHVLSVLPTTKVREASGWSRDAINTATTTSFDHIEVGDHVQVVYRSVETRRQGQGRQNEMKHGRHRLYWGEAISLAILPHASQSRNGPSSTDKDRDKTDADKSTTSKSDDKRD